MAHFLVYLGHPAHFHLFKNTIRRLTQNGHQISVLIKKKDILEELLIRSNIPFENILPEGRADHKLGIALGVLRRDYRLLRYCIKRRPSLLIGTSAEIGHVGTLLGIPSINVNEDDAAVIPLYCKISYPWSTIVLSPQVCDNGKWEGKSVKYHSYHELAYLHPNHFTPTREVVENYFSLGRPFFLIRFAKLTAHHDSGIQGISNALALRIVELLTPHGNVFITSERELSTELEPYRMVINPLDIHHVMAFADLYIGDSQTMAAEAGVLGVPFLRFNDFVGRIGYLGELEEKYHLGFGISPNDPEKLLSTVKQLVTAQDTRAVFAQRRQAMLKDKIDLAKFLTWFMEQYPESAATMRRDPSYQNRFR